MIRADIDVSAFFRWADSRGMTGCNAFDPGFAMHCLLTESFGPDLAPRPYRAILPRGQGRNVGTFYAYSTSTVEELREAAQSYACPLQSKVLPMSSIDGKKMPMSWPNGQRLGFEVLIRPTVRCARGTRTPGKERDAFQVVSERREEGAMSRNREDVYRDWLSRRLSPRGACLEDARLSSFQIVPVVRKLGSPSSEGPDALIRGSLEVTDSEAFTEMIEHGVGRHRAYGYGMILLRPPPVEVRQHS